MCLCFIDSGRFNSLCELIKRNVCVWARADELIFGNDMKWKFQLFTYSFELLFGFRQRNRKINIYMRNLLIFCCGGKSWRLETRPSAHTSRAHIHTHMANVHVGCCCCRWHFWFRSEKKNNSLESTFFVFIFFRSWVKCKFRICVNSIIAPWTSGGYSMKSANTSQKFYLFIFRNAGNDLFCLYARIFSRIYCCFEHRNKNKSSVLFCYSASIGVSFRSRFQFRALFNHALTTLTMRTSLFYRHFFCCVNFSSFSLWGRSLGCYCAGAVRLCLLHDKKNAFSRSRSESTILFQIGWTLCGKSSSIYSILFGGERCNCWRFAYI